MAVCRWLVPPKADTRVKPFSFESLRGNPQAFRHLRRRVYKVLASFCLYAFKHERSFFENHQTPKIAAACYKRH